MAEMGALAAHFRLTARQKRKTCHKKRTEHTFVQSERKATVFRSLPPPFLSVSLREIQRNKKNHSDAYFHM